MKPELRAALFFLPEKTIAGIAPLGAGNINDTFTVTLHSGERRILQRLNPSVFPDPQAVMHNMLSVLAHLRGEIQKESAGRDDFQIPELYSGESGSWFEGADGSVWRLMSLVEDSTTCSVIGDPVQSRELGRCLGLFHRLLRSLDPAQLHDTLPDIHNTAKYLHAFDAIYSRHGLPPSAEEEFCTVFIGGHRHLPDLPGAEEAGLTRGVIHGDPKMDNFLFDNKQQRVVSLIDLDTVKPGLLLHDIGDALRSCCNTEGETARRGGRICFDPAVFHDWLTGYFSQAGLLLNSRDLACIVDFVRLIAFELGLRFYSDYLDGNRYFKIRSPEQNLQRALVQFHLVESIEQQWDHLQALVITASETHT